MDELQERDEINRLVEEQRKDDTNLVQTEFSGLNTVPIETLADSLAVTPDGGIVMFGQREKGTVLVGSAPYHGTISGYVNHKCKCVRCKGAHAARVRRQRAQRKAKKDGA